MLSQTHPKPHVQLEALSLGLPLGENSVRIRDRMQVDIFRESDR
jgi:hypothetical protein